MKKDLYKRIMFKTASVALILGLCTTWPWMRASAAGTGAETASAGSIVYEDGPDSVAIYTEDIALLKEKLCSVRAETYDPASYGHVHQWDFTDITESTHTERCSLCGTSGELVNAHSASSAEKCVITYEGEAYPGNRYRCACGFEWTQERYHTPVYTPIDDTCHAVSCALQGTAYCAGMGEIEGEHMSVPQPTDERHHRMVCEYCNYAGEEQECVFDLEGATDEGSTAQQYRYCECGNYLITGETEEPSVPPEESAETVGTPPALSDKESDGEPTNPQEGPENQENEGGNE